MLLGIGCYTGPVDRAALTLASRDQQRDMALSIYDVRSLCNIYDSAMIDHVSIGLAESVRASPGCINACIRPETSSNPRVCKPSLLQRKLPMSVSTTDDATPSSCTVSPAKASHTIEHTQDQLLTPSTDCEAGYWLQTFQG